MSRRLHLTDIRLYNNAGISMPVCKAGAELLDMDATAFTQIDSDEYRKNENNEKEQTCKHCIKAWARRYSWAPLDR